MSFPMPADERRQPPGEPRTWCEAFSFEFFGTDGTGGYLTLVLLPNQGRSWVWACVVGPDGPVTVVDNDLPLPAELAVGGGVVSAELRCVRPLEQWVAAMESERMSMRLRFDTAGEVSAPPATAYAFPCRVYGRLRVGVEQIEVDVFGWRGHLWGDVDWSRLGTRVIGRLDDGSRLVETGPGPEAPDGVTVSPVARTVVPAAAPDGSPVPIRRDLCRVTLTDGRSGWGWLAGLAPRG